MSKLVVIVQCDNVTKRCSGIWCMTDFYDKIGAFEVYEDDTRYMSMTCGGCCGNLVAAKFENLKQKMVKKNIRKEDIVVHLASCIVSDNSHRTPCPFRMDMKKILERKGFTVKFGTHISKTAQARRDAGIYASW